MENNDQFELGRLLYQDWKQQNQQNGSYQQLRKLGQDNINFQSVKNGFKSERERLNDLDSKETYTEAFYSAVNEVGTHHFPCMSEVVTVKICYGYGIVFSVDLHTEIGTPDEVLREKAIEHFKKFMPNPEQVEKVETYLEEDRAWLKVKHEGSYRHS